MAALSVNTARFAILLFCLFSLSLNSFLAPLYGARLLPLLIAGIAGVTIAVAAAFALGPPARKPIGKMRPAALNFLLVFILCGVTATLVLPPALQPVRWVEILSFLAVPFLFVVLLPSAILQKDYESLFKALLVVMTGISAVALGIYATETTTLFGLPLAFAGFREENFIRYCFYQNRNYAAMAIAWAPALSASFWLKEKRALPRVVYALCFFVTTAHLFFTFSRGGQLAAFIACLPLFGPVYQKNRRALFFVLSGLALALIIVAFVHPFVQYKMGKLFTLSNRFSLWADAVLHLSGTEWLSGVGLYNYFPRGENPHGAYVSLLLYFGLTGLFTFAGFLVFALKPFFARNRRMNLPTHDRVLWSILCGSLVCGLYEDNLSYAYYFPQIVFWLFAGWVAGKGDGRIPAEKKERPALRLIKTAA